jgi:hypothetical protein
VSTESHKNPKRIGGRRGQSWKDTTRPKNQQGETYGKSIRMCTQEKNIKADTNEKERKNN